jgi:hypothetical protein
LDEKISTVLRNLKLRGLEGIYAENSDEAKFKILSLIPEKAVVGIGDSTTVRQVGIIEELKVRGTKVLDGFYKGVSWERHYELVKKSTLCDVFLTGTNAITLDGKLVNVDALGNRVAGIFYGHRMSIVVVGRNKLVENLEQAFYRIRNLIAPNHIKIRVKLGGRQLKTPCVTTGKCSDCKSTDRLCNVFTIIEGKPLRTDLYVIIINEDLGLAWDESWPKERISKIIKAYEKYVWVPPASS